MDTCAECGFSYDLAAAETSGAAIRRDADEVARFLVAGGEQVRTRVRPDRWSSLEYGCHLRDVLLVQRERLLAARREVRPSVAPMGRDERVEHDGYGEQDPADVARQVIDAALLMANALDRIEGPEWDRTLVYNYPAEVERSLRWLALHTEHEARHHLLDVGARRP